ncbi:hypothetical protein [Allocoleopsis franciscana]|uniref:Uncharacterized protein n=1 Tax=Allocoleopsis franciscana PCC 7113 TaxID=1173027 RepID=K9WCW2_9CYAN|nr:hypothetical protein [Allocoleopsis franciscana]AFZ17636.1 hypothetical protein Mic7113_1778 [Allocoleopsis franciscana PCC 7113]
MSFHEQNIAAFIEVLKTKRSLFSPQDWAILDKLAASLPEDEEKISEIIATWYEKRPKILDAQLDILNTLLNNELNVNRFGSTLTSGNAEADIDYRAELINAIKTSGKSM